MIKIYLIAIPEEILEKDNIQTNEEEEFCKSE